MNRTVYVPITKKCPKGERKATDEEEQKIKNDEITK